MSNTKKPTIWIDNLRAIACIFVILLHVSAPWLHHTEWRDWGILGVIHSLTRSSVPLFLMISGALLLPKKLTFANFYSDRFSKIWRPFLFWTTVYTFIFLAYSVYQGKTYSLPLQLEFIYNSFIYGAAYHLWYMYLIIVFYFSLLFIGDIDNKLNKTQLKGFLILWILILASYQFKPKHITLDYMYFIFGYFGYFILGHYLYKYIGKISKGLSLLIVIFGLLLTFYPIYHQVLSLDKYPSEWFSYRSINIMILSIGVFLTFRSIPFESKLLSAVSSRSFGIYLVHLIIIMFLNKIWTYTSIIPISIYVFVFSLITLILSYYSIIILERIPLIRRYIY